MKHKFKEFLEGLDYSEVLEFQKELKDPSSTVRKVLGDHVDVMERISARICATCGNQLDPHTKNMTLVFGPDDFKKKASFCAFDCLEFFMDHLKQLEIKKEKSKQL